MADFRSNQGRAQATRGLTALSLLSLMVVASADRALLASRPGGPGALHAIAVTDANYWVTNGNGTFTYAPLSPITAVNTAYGAATAATGGAGLFSSDATALGVGALKSASINHVLFPSKSLGIAVGVAAGLVFPVTGTTAASVTGPSILLTIDAGLTWMVTTGVPATTAAEAVPGAAATSTDLATLPYPAQLPGDLQKLYCASKSTCWAVGGNIAAVESLYDYTAPATGSDAIYLTGPAAGPSAAVVYMTTNGGTVWKSVPTYYSLAQTTAAVAGTSTTVLTNSAMKAIAAATVPGGLYSISGDSAGKNIYAVGAPGSTMTGTTVGVFSYVANVVPTIMYSGNAGATWTLQTAPALAGATTYTLFDVAVLKGTTAWAVGGTMTAGSSAPTTATGNNVPIGSCSALYGSNGGCNGQIIMTNNGGFSWVQTVFPSSAGKNAPAFTSVAVNGPMVWVGGFVRQDKHYPLAPVAATTTTPVVNGQSYTVLVSVDGGLSFKGAAAGYATFPAGFVLGAAEDPPSAVYANDGASTPTYVATYDTTVKDVTGIVWDNTNRGYIFGNGFIMGTQDAGKTWTYETPNGIVTGTAPAATMINTMANVPTTY